MVNVSQPFIALCPNERVSNASPGTSCFVQAKDQDMRDFRDAKAMAHTLRAALATKGYKVTNSESLELIAQAFGVADWNTLSASIREEAAGPPNNAAAPQFPTTATMHRALAYARQRKHQYATLEHLLLALIDDEDASAVMKACKVDLGARKEKLTNYIDNDLKTLVIDDGGEPKHTAGFQRVVQRAAHYAEGRGRLNRTGAELLVAIFAETESPAARLLGLQNMTRQDAINFIIHGTAKGGGDATA
jgi:Glyoxalase superfamily protein/Clp amino terminal domain, pathogenicity island component